MFSVFRAGRSGKRSKVQEKNHLSAILNKSWLTGRNSYDHQRAAQRLNLSGKQYNALKDEQVKQLEEVKERDLLHREMIDMEKKFKKEICEEQKR